MGLAPDGRGAFQMPQQERSVRAARQGRLAPPRGTSRACARHLFPNVERRASNVARKRRRTDETGKTDGNGPSDGRGGVRSRCRNGGETVSLSGTIAITGIAPSPVGRALRARRAPDMPLPANGVHGVPALSVRCTAPWARHSPARRPARQGRLAPPPLDQPIFSGHNSAGNSLLAAPADPECRKIGKPANRQTAVASPPCLLTPDSCLLTPDS